MLAGLADSSHAHAGLQLLANLILFMFSTGLQMLAGLAWLTFVVCMQARQAQEAAAQHSRRQ